MPERPPAAPRSEVRLDRLRPAEARAALDRAPIAWVPLGALEYHADHLPIGTDGWTATGLVERAARLAGGVVLPWSYLTLGTLLLPFSLRFDRDLVARVLEATLTQLPDHGIRLAVVHTGHAPLDLVHLVKRVCREIDAAGSLRAYGVCYLELNAALGAGLGTDWPVAIDHGSVLETSWMQALRPELVDLDRLPADDGAPITGVYGPHPRGRASADLGHRQQAAAARLLADRALALLAGEPLDPLADLRVFVDRYWPEAMEVTGSIGIHGEAVIGLHNPGPVSRYLSALGVRFDGVAVSPDEVWLSNDAPGENTVAVRAASLGAESGFYVRRGQTALVRFRVPAAGGPHRVHLELGLGGVARTELQLELDLPRRWY